jgi:hypothetical protein
VTFEIKYALPLWRADAVGAWLDARCERDPQYPEGHVRTLYLDTPDLRFLTEKADGDFLKTKIRLRWYAAHAHAPAAGAVWLEIKRRESLSRSKTRLAFHPRAADVDRSDLEGIDAGRASDLVRAAGLEAPARLRPTLALGYQRSRWIEPVTGVRVALDRAIQPTWARACHWPPPHALALSSAVVEFKGADPEVPWSLRALTGFGGRRTSFSKYYRCYARLHAGAVPDDGGDR